MEGKGDLSSFSARELERQGLLKYVSMSHCDATTARDPQPYIGTSSLASCAGVAIYDRDKQVGGVAHVFFNEKNKSYLGRLYARQPRKRDRKLWKNETTNYRRPLLVSHI